MQTGILIVGGGLSGLSLAWRLEASGRACLLVEARERLGGRIHSVSAKSTSGHDDRYDLGPAWFWPGQPLMAGLTKDLGLRVFEQHSVGRLVLQEANGSVHRALDFSTMAGSLRLADGMMRLIDGLQARVPARKVLAGHVVSELTQTEGGVRATVIHDGRAREIDATHVVLAVPPRLAASAIRFDPVLTAPQMASMKAVPTWMADQAKVIAIYPTPFWRAAGLSGDGISRRGPLAEIHDASPASGSQGALFGFVGVSAEQRRGQGEALINASVAQLTQMFGPEAAIPVDVLVKDWSVDEYTATAADHRPPEHHPGYWMPKSLTHLWHGRLILAATELTTIYGGYLEGALEASELAFRSLVSDAAENPPAVPVP